MQIHSITDFFFPENSFFGAV